MTDEQFAVIHDWLTAKIAERQTRIRGATILDEDEIRQWEWEAEEFEGCLMRLVNEKDEAEDREEDEERKRLEKWKGTVTR